MSLISYYSVSGLELAAVSFSTPEIESFSRRFGSDPFRTAILEDPFIVKGDNLLTAADETFSAPMFAPTLMGIDPFYTATSITNTFDLFQTESPTQTVGTHFIPSPTFKMVKARQTSSTSSTAFVSTSLGISTSSGFTTVITASTARPLDYFSISTENDGPLESKLNNINLRLATSSALNACSVNRGITIGTMVSIILWLL